MLNGAVECLLRYPITDESFDQGDSVRRVDQETSAFKLGDNFIVGQHRSPLRQGRAPHPAPLIVLPVQ